MNTVIKQVMALLLAIAIIFPNVSIAAQSGGETITGTQILTDSVNVSCLAYEVIGICVWLTCTISGCSIDTSIKVKHFTPDAVVTAYQNTGESPWTDTSSYSQPNSMAQDGGSNKEGSRNHNETALLFKNVDVIGSPGSLWINALSNSGYFCNTTTTPYFAYMLSTLDPNWRNPLVETPMTVANIHRFLRHGLSTWGGIYPRIGFIHNTHDYKAGALAAQRAADITTRNYQPHVYWPMVDSGSPGQWPPGAVVEGDADTHKWQQLIPSSQSGECRIFADISDQASGLTDPFQQRVSQITGYAFNLWRPYRCCDRVGASLIFHSGN